MKGIFTICLLITAVSASSQTTVSGLIFSNQIWNPIGSPYHITGNVQVNAGVTLVIEPGVDVIFDGDYGLKVLGTIIAAGTLTDSIRFRSANEPNEANNYRGIQMKDSGSILNADYSFASGSKFAYCSFRNAATALYVYNTSLYVENCSFAKNATGIEPRKTGRSLIRNCRFFHNATGIMTTYEDNSPGADQVGCITELKIQNCQFVDNTAGCNLNMNQRTFDQLRVTECAFTDNTDGCIFGGGGYGPFVANTFFDHNLFFNNSRGLVIDKIYGAGFNGCSGIQTTGLIIERNRLISNSSRNLEFIYSGNAQHIVRNNVIAGSDYGVRFTGSSSALLLENSFTDNLNSVHLNGPGNYEPINVTVQNCMFSNTRKCEADYVIRNSVVNNTTLVSQNNFIHYTGNVLENIDQGNSSFTGNYTTLQSGEVIGDVIVDIYDDAIYGMVTVTSVQSAPRIDVPLSAPINVTKTLSGNDVVISWSPNPEADVAGYKVYYGNYNGYGFSSFVDAGNATSYIFPGVLADEVFAVTAYDNQAGSAEDQLIGHESWFGELSGPPIPPDPSQGNASPTCSSGVDLFIDELPGPCVEWYWQLAPDGTTMGMPVDGIYTVYENGLYYVRAYNTSTSMWSPGVSSITVVSIPGDTYSTINAVACFSYTLNEVTYSESGEYEQILPNMAGCDSLITLILEITDLIETGPENLVVYSGNSALFTVISPFPDATYQWQTDIGFGFQNLSNAGQYSGVFTSTLTVSNTSLMNNNQFFRCLVQSGSCTDLSDAGILTVNQADSINEESAHSAVAYPNPVTGDLYVRGTGVRSGAIWFITDQSGRRVITGNITGGLTRIDCSGLASGVYTMISTGGEFRPIRFIVE